MDKNLYSYCKLLFLWTMNVLILSTSRSSASEDIQLYSQILDTKIGKRFEIKCTANITEFSFYTCPILEWNIDTQNVTFGSIEEIKENLITLSFNNNYTQLNGNFYCEIYKLPDTDICDIKIGRPPQEVQDFQCIFVDLMSFTCNFTEPDNYVNTSYDLKFWKDDLPYDESNGQSKSENCPLNKTLAHSRFCQIGVHTAPVYASSMYQYFIFNLTSKNIFGSKFKIFSIHHFENVLFSKPTVEMANKSPDSITIQWDGEYIRKLQIANQFCYGGFQNNSCLIYDVRIKSEYDTNWRPVQFTDDIYIPSTNDLSFQNKIVGLNPHTSYELEMRMKALNASSRLWSERGSKKFQTLCKNPDIPPKVDIGSFHIDDNGYIQIYWKLLEKSEENCDNVSYSLSDISDKTSINTKKIVDTMLKLNIKAEDDYMFEIKSSNSIGYSNNGSIVNVPKEVNRFPSPRFLRNIVKDGEYHFSWESPENISGIVDYTVFWCRNYHGSANHCENASINFYHVNSSVTNITQNGTDYELEFAVSANSISSSSGMIWAKCAAAEDTEILSFEPVIEVADTSIRLRWNLSCSQRTVIDRFVVKFCGTNEPSCNNNFELSRNIERLKINQLKPYTDYMIIIYAYSANFQKKVFSVKQKTLQAAPSPPQNLTVRDITDTTITLTWNRPDDLRGILQYYEVFYNNVSIKIENNMKPKDEEIYILKDLKSYHDYEIYVIAHTVGDSNHSDHIKLRTAIGTPGSLNQPNITENQSEIIISWQPPLKKSGRIEFYEIKRIIQPDNKPMEITYKMFSTICRLDITQTCNGNNENIFSIRAINIAPKKNYYLSNNIHLNFEQIFEFQEKFDSIIPIRNNSGSTIIYCENNKNIEDWLNSAENQSVEIIKGNWSSISRACQYTAESSGLFWYIIIGIIGGIVLLFSLVGFVIYGYKAYKKHSDIDCIPPTLKSSEYELDVADITYLQPYLQDVDPSRRSSSGFDEETYEYVIPEIVEQGIDDKQQTYVKQMDPIECIDLAAPDGYLQMNVYQEMCAPTLPYDSDSVRSSVPDTDNM